MIYLQPKALNFMLDNYLSYFIPWIIIKIGFGVAVDKEYESMPEVFQMRRKVLVVHACTYKGVSFFKSKFSVLKFPE